MGGCGALCQTGDCYYIHLKSLGLYMEVCWNSPELSRRPIALQPLSLSPGKTEMLLKTETRCFPHAPPFFWREYALWLLMQAKWLQRSLSMSVWRRLILMSWMLLTSEVQVTKGYSVTITRSQWGKNSHFPPLLCSILCTWCLESPIWPLFLSYL